jgi:hypothetical protein
VDPRFDAVETTLAVQQMLQVVPEEQRAALVARARRLAGRFPNPPRQEQVVRRRPTIAASLATDPTAGAESRVRNLSHTPESLRCGGCPRRLTPRRVGVKAIAIAFLGMMIVLAQPEGPCRPAAHAAGASLLDNAPAEIRSEVEINGSPEFVWQVLADLARYPVWNPFLYPVEGELHPRNPLQVTMHANGRIVTYTATVLQIERNRVLSWSAQALSSRVFDTIYSFTIEPAPGGRARLVARETRRGLSRIVEWLVGSDIQRGLDAMTRSVRNRVELLRPPGGFWRPSTTYFGE